VDRDLVQLAVKVPQGHVHGGLGTGVVHPGLLDQGGDGLEVVHLLPHQSGADQFDDAPHDAAGGVPGDGAGGRGFAVAHGAGVGVQFHHHILHAADGAQGGLEGDPQGDRQLA